MGAWVKFFKDTSPEIGTDLAIEESKASWSRGRQKNITKVQLSDRLSVVTLEVPDTEWYQFDRYHVLFNELGQQKSIRIARVIQARIQNKHVGRHLLYNGDTYFFQIKINGKEKGYIIEKKDVGKWLTVSIADSKISFCFAEKGKLDGHQQVSR